MYSRGVDVAFCPSETSARSRLAYDDDEHLEQGHNLLTPFHKIPPAAMNYTHTHASAHEKTYKIKKCTTGER